MNTDALVSSHQSSLAPSLPVAEPLPTPARLPQTVLGLVLILNSFLVGRLMSGAELVAAISAMIGAIILGYPIVWTAIQDLRRGLLRTNELVAIAVLASFASGHYQEAGIVAFFMLLGEIIETRTAEGARRSIELLIKLTPGKARRLANGAEEEIAVKDLRVGYVIRVRPGDNVAGTNADDIAHAQILDGDFLFGAVGEAARLAGRELDEQLDGASRALGGARLDDFAEQH